MVVLCATLLGFLTGCSVWIDDASLPQVSGNGETGPESDTGAAAPVCGRGEAELYVGVPGDAVWAGQRVHVRFEAPVPTSEVSLVVVARDGQQTELLGRPFNVQLAADQVQIFEPPEGGWVPDTTHDLTLTYGDNCTVDASFTVGTLGFPDRWNTFGRVRLVADLSTGTVLPLGLGLPDGVVESEVLIDFRDSWSDGDVPEGAVMAGAVDGEPTTCGDRSLGATGLAPGPGSVVVPYTNLAVVYDGALLPSEEGDLVVALGTSFLEAPQFSLWLRTSQLDVPDICERTACRTCSQAGAQCALILLEDVALDYSDTDLNPANFICSAITSDSCPTFCEP